jgi:hypothetical protein
MVSGRQANLSPTQQQTASSAPELAKVNESINNQQSTATAVPTRQPRDIRRLMEKTQAASAAADRSGAEVLEHLPNVDTVKFKKIGKLFVSLLDHCWLHATGGGDGQVGSSLPSQYTT